MYRILVADDDKNEREGIRYLIDKLELPLRVSMAFNGRHALELFSQDAYDMLLTDIKMPFMDGLELAKQAKEIKPALKVIILSGHGEFEYAKKAILINVAEYLLKPIEPNEFEASLRKVIQLCKQDEQRDRMLLRLTDAEEDTAVTERATELRNGIADSELHARAVEEVIRIIAKEYERDLSLEYLAKRVHLSVSYLSHIFKKATGTSVIKHINHYRMEKAKEFLCEENYKIVDIYRMVGFSDASYFGMAFKNHYGLTPTQFRAKVRPR
ncbi:response regulator transcription factor [Cohnella silvisoli]|uniref:Response regulator n=1 Tax=Cohnella silvisoli TaxID=2873699 RepID=A0ABV1KS58_9BACL|nr:response regulator [Cohnella silvisoli]MCD9022649.1 response regulator [Cohnella silvisoli]